MTEDFIQYVWKFQLFKSINLKTTTGKSVKIIHKGIQNFSSGPDFTNAKIELEGQLWAGNVEIHLKQENWNHHKHQNDEAYNNVILHVIYGNTDKDAFTKNGIRLETVVLKDLIFRKTQEVYNFLMKTKSTFVPCQNIILKQKEFFISSFYDRLLTERLERKIKDIEKDIELSVGDLDKAFLINLFKYFGAPQNKIPFEILARNLNINHIIKQAVSIESLEALLFGVAGFLEENETECSYKNKLENEYNYQKQLYKIDTPMKISNWKFAAVRPANFPTIRIAQLSSLLFKDQRWFSLIQNDTELNNIKEKFKISVSNFWKTHYNFGMESKKSNKNITQSFFDKIMINLIAPFLFYYGKFVQDEQYIEKVFDILVKIKPEKNRITNSWQGIGLSNNNAFESQALIELKQNYCDKRRCLDCNIGYKILNNE